MSEDSPNPEGGGGLMIIRPAPLSAPRPAARQAARTAAAVLRTIAAVLDDRPAAALPRNPVWLEMSARRLAAAAGQGGQSSSGAQLGMLRATTGQDGAGLCDSLDRLTEIRITDSPASDRGATMLSEWRLEDRGETVRLLIPPAAAEALRSPDNQAQLEEAALRLLPRAARHLHAELRARSASGRGRREYGLDELRAVLGAAGRYAAWRDLRRKALIPALAAVNGFGTVQAAVHAADRRPPPRHRRPSPVALEDRGRNPPHSFENRKTDPAAAAGNRKTVVTAPRPRETHPENKAGQGRSLMLPSQCHSLCSCRRPDCGEGCRARAVH